MPAEPMTDEEIEAKEARAKDWRYRGSEPYRSDCLALVAEVRRLREYRGHVALKMRIGVLEVLMGRLVDAWDVSWDCSSTPGHEAMHEAVAAARAALPPAKKPGGNDG